MRLCGVIQGAADGSRADAGTVPLSEFNNRATGHAVTIVLRSGEKLDRTFFAARMDTIYYAQNFELCAVPIRKVQSVSIVRDPPSALLTVPLGAIAGGLIGAGVGETISGGYWSGFAGFAIGIGVGVASGFALAQSGSLETYEFDGP